MGDVDAILITHVHPDHVDVDKLGAVMREHPSLEVYAPESVSAEIDGVRVVSQGDRLTIGDLDVEVRGSEHAQITRCQPIAENVGYLFNGQLLHPGDAFHPISDVDTALVPVNGPWVKMLDVESYLERNRPKRIIGIHDGIVNEFGLAINEKLLTLLSKEYGCDYLPLRPGESVEL